MGYNRYSPWLLRNDLSDIAMEVALKWSRRIERLHRLLFWFDGRYCSCGGTDIYKKTNRISSFHSTAFLLHVDWQLLQFSVGVYCPIKQNYALQWRAVFVDDGSCFAHFWRINLLYQVYVVQYSWSSANNMLSCDTFWLFPRLAYSRLGVSFYWASWGGYYLHHKCRHHLAASKGSNWLILLI